MHARPTGYPAIASFASPIKSLLALAAILAAIALAPISAFATVYTWDADANPANGATDGSGTWDLSGMNWFNSGTDIAWTNSSADIANFGQGAGGAGGTVTLGTTLGAGGISFTGGDTGSFTIAGTGGATLMLAPAGILVNAGAGAETFDGSLPISLFSSQSWANNSASPLTFNGNISAASFSSLAIGGSGDTTINGVLSDGSSRLEITVNAGTSGVVTLNAANTYTGATGVSSGTLRVNNTTGSATGTNSVLINTNGALQGPSAAGHGFISGAVSVSGNAKLLVQSGATLTLSGGLTLANSSSSTLTLSGTPNGATGAPLVATGTGGATSLTISSPHTINVSASSAINPSPAGMPYGLYELYSYFGTPPSVTSTTSPFTGVFTPGTAPAGFNLGLFEGTSAATTITNNQLDVAVSSKPFVYLKSLDTVGTTSFNTAGNWSNAAAPSSASNYVVSLNSLRSPTGATAATFAGNSLTLGAGGQLGIKTTGNGTTTTIPTLVLNGGTVSNSAGSDGNNYSDVVAGTNFLLTSTSIFDTLNGGVGTRNLTISAPISGSGGLIINPTLASISTVTLTKANSYTGTTTVDAGGFQLGAGGSLAATSVLTLGSGTSSATFTLGDATAPVNQTLSSLTVVGTGTANAVVGGNTGISTLTINNNGPDIFGGTIGGSGTNQNNLALYMFGNGTLTLSGANTYTGGTIIYGAGTLQLSGNGTLGDVNNPLQAGGGTLDLNNVSVGVGNLTGAGGTILNNGGGTATLTVGNRNATGGSFGGAIADNNNTSGGTVALTKTGSGTITLSGANTYTGATAVNGGTLAIAAPGGLGNTAITVSATASFSARPGSGTLVIGSTSNPSAGSTITLNPGGGAVNGGTFDMLDGAIGTVVLNQGANVATGMQLGTTGPLNTPALAFEIGDNGTTTAADHLFVTNGVVVGSGTGAEISITPIGSNPLHTGTYPLITAGGFTNATDFSLATPAISIGSNQYNLSLANTGTVENLIVSLAGLPVAYWSGKQNSVWNALTPAPGGTNWLNAPAGTDAGALPSSGTNVYFTANTAANLTTTLGQDFTINSLTFTGAGTSATKSVTISGNTLTINASTANGNPAGSGIVVQSGSGAHTIASNIVLAASQSWTNNSTNPLTLTGNVGDGGHAVSLTIAGSGPITLAGAMNLAGGSSLIMRGGSILEVDGGTSLGDTSSISVEEGTLRFAPTLGAPSVGTGVTASITGGAILELAGSVSSLGTTVAGHRANIQNSSTAAAGLLITGTNQLVSRIDGNGATQVNAGAQLTADHIVQAALIIGGDATHPAVVTIAASDPSGNPLSAPGSFANPNAAGLIASSSDSISGSGVVATARPSTSFAVAPAGSRNLAGETAVPEPSTALLVAIAIAAVAAGKASKALWA